MKIGLVGCGKKKENTAKPAAYLYSSQYFELKRNYADQECDIWFILSAKHGLVKPHKIIEPYNTNIKEVDSDKWSHKVINQLQEILHRDDEIIFLAGKDYIEPVKPFFEAAPYQTKYPFKETSGIGEQISFLKDNITTSQKTLDEVSE